MEAITLVSHGAVLYPRSRDDYTALVGVNYPLTIIPKTAVDALQTVLSRSHGGEFQILEFDDVAVELREAALNIIDEDDELVSRVTIHPSTTSQSVEMKFMIVENGVEALNSLLDSLGSDDYEDALVPRRSAEELAAHFEKVVLEPLTLHLGKYQHRLEIRKQISGDGSILFGVKFTHDPDMNNIMYFSPRGKAESDAVIVNFSPNYRIRFEMVTISLTDAPEPALRMQVEERHGDTWENNGVVPRTFLMKNTDKESAKRLAMFLLTHF